MSDHRERRQGNDKMAEDIGYIKGMLEGLAGPEGRITKLEKTNSRQWWFHSVQVLLITGLTSLRKYGVL